MARPRKTITTSVRLEGDTAAAQIQDAVTKVFRHPDPVPGNNGEALARIVAWFRAEHPDKWGAMCFGPLAYGLEQMIEIARGE